MPPRRLQHFLAEGVEYAVEQGGWADRLDQHAVDLPVGTALVARPSGEPLMVGFDGLVEFPPHALQKGEITDTTKASAVLRYQSAGDPLLSGWLLGGARLNGQAALVDATVGTGHVYLYGFRPQYRAQTNATWPLIWSAILR